jgi:hypothetical protein
VLNAALIVLIVVVWVVILVLAVRSDGPGSTWPRLYREAGEDGDGDGDGD